MAEPVRKNVDQEIVRTLERRAKRLGSTVEAEAFRTLEALRKHNKDVYDFLVGIDSEVPEQAAGTSLPDAPPDTGRSNGLPDAPTQEERQAALADDYPDEYVVLLGERIVVHTTNKDEAYAHYDAAFGEAGNVEPIVIPPGALRRIGPPIIRGRAHSVASGAGPR